MSACFGAVVRAPLTALLMIFEMTHQFSIVPALMLGTLVSQFLARQAGPVNFYEAILEQDGHELSRIHPPRDLESWQNQPVGAIMNRRPVVLRSLEPADVRLALVRHPFRAFPVETRGRYAGVALRDDLLAVVRGESPRLRPAMVCRESQSIREVADGMVASSTGCAVLVEGDGGAVRGFLTLHDLLRAQTRVTE
jgi:CIC family chloride channel protein